MVSSFNLKILWDYAHDLILPSIDEPGVTIWRDREQNLCALGHKINSEYWIHILEVGSYYFSKEQDEVTAIPKLATDVETLIDEYSRTVLPLALQVRGYEVLHASAIETSCGIIALCAPSETGKSTLAYALRQRGYPTWADDAVIVDISEDQIIAQPLPFNIRLRVPSAVHFGCATDETLASYRWESELQQSSQSRPILAICLLEQLNPSRNSKPVVHIESALPAEAFPRIMKHAHYFNPYDKDRKQKMAENFLALVGSVPTFKVRFQRGLHHLSEILDGLEENVLGKVQVEVKPSAKQLSGYKPL